MANTRQLKTRIRSVKSTRQITKAMQLVAASKMRRAQEATQALHMFAEAARELLTYLRSLPDTKTHHMYVQRPLKSRLVVIVTGDRGLAGAYNTNVLKRYAEILKTDRADGIDTKTICIGKKAAQFAGRIKDADVMAAYSGFPDHPTEAELRPIVNTMVSEFSEDNVQSVEVLYTKYVSSIVQEATTQTLLPAGFQETEVSAAVMQSSFEPSVEEVLEATTIRLIEAQLLQALLDAVASEHSMRMLAMKNATDNAGDLVDDLTLAMNKVRQAAITQELAEISGGSEAMKE